MSLAVIDRTRSLRRVPPGRAAQAAGNVTTIGNRLGYHMLAPFTDAVRDRARVYVDLRGRRQSQRIARADGEAARLDKAIDTHVAFIHDIARRYATDLPETPEGRAGRGILRRHFGQGLAAVVRAPYEEELILVERLLDDLRGDAAPQAEALNVERHIAAIEGLLPRYRRALDIEDKVSAKEVGDAYAGLQVAYLEMVAAILTLVRDAEHRDLVLAPVFDQDDRLAAVYAARRRGRTVVEQLDPDAEAEAALVAELEAEALADELEAAEVDRQRSEAPTDATLDASVDEADLDEEGDGSMPLVSLPDLGRG